MTNIFKTPAEMPPKDNSPDVVRIAQTMPEMHKDYTPAAAPHREYGVDNLTRPRRGHGY